MLYRCELKKSLVTHRGMLILALCLIMKLVLFCVIPEQKDPRILLSQKQYDKYLAQLYGENTPEKSNWILAEYEKCRQIKENQELMQAKYSRGELSEAQWSAYAEQLRLAELQINSAKIFAEKAEQFLQQPEGLPPSHFIYEYGWQTVFTLLQFPDIFLSFGLLLLTAQSFCAEAAIGMLPVLLSAKNGRQQLYNAKLFSLLTVSVMGSLASSGLELCVFSLRGWCSDAAAPLYSVTVLTDCTLPLSLGQGLALCLAVRLLVVMFLTAMLFGMSVWTRSATNLGFLGMCLLLLPLLWNSAGILYTHGGLLSGTRMLLHVGNSPVSLLLPLAVVMVYSASIAVLAAKRHCRGL